MARVLLAGGGIGGLTAALCLHRAGHQVTVFESVRQPRELGVGINLLPHSVRVLHDLGLADELDALGVRTSRLRFHSEDGVEIWSEPRGIEAGNPWPQYSIHRGRLQVLLLEAARRRLGTERVLTGHHLVGAEQGRHGVRARFADKTGGDDRGTYEGDLLVGADGLHSAVRRLHHPDEGPPRYAGLVLWRGAVEAEPFEDGRTMVMAGHDRLKAVVYPISPPDPATGRVLTNWVAERPVEVDVEAADWNRPADPASFAPWFDAWRWGWLDVPALFRATPVCYEFPMVDRDPLERWTHGRVTLLGDAAHPMRPNGSNGASQAILDAEALAQALTAEADPAAALERYEEQRRDATSAIVLANRRTGPEQVLQWVHDRCPGTCVGHHTCIPRAELEEVATAYKRLAGFDPAALRERARSAAAGGPAGEATASDA